jgi:hypothetical protein
MAAKLLARIEAGETVQRRQLAALAHAALELPAVLLARAVLEQKGPLAIKRAIELAELMLGSEAGEHGDGHQNDELG